MKQNNVPGPELKKVLKKRKMDHDFALRLDPTIQIRLKLSGCWIFNGELKGRKTRVREWQNIDQTVFFSVGFFCLILVEYRGSLPWQSFETHGGTFSRFSVLLFTSNVNLCTFISLDDIYSKTTELSHTSSIELWWFK